ncbi:MAG: HNH endonuclease [Calditrichaeota bacterium]|nr:HNH endonuclease [Calditrichota bacterium]
MAEAIEIWKPIANTDGFYEASNFGRIRSWQNNTNTPGRRLIPLIMKLTFDDNYKTIMIKCHGERITKLVHGLVAETFIPNPLKKPQINHIDGNKLNNNVNNLEWAKRSENQKHAHKNGLMHPPKGSQHWSTSLSEEDVIRIRELYKSGDYLQREIAQIYDISRSEINMIVNHRGHI